MYNAGMRIGVYGLGRFGSFWAREIARHHKEVYGYDIAPVEKIDGVQISDEKTVLDCQVIFFCVPISAFESVMERVRQSIKPGTLVMDTCSVKVHPAEVMGRKLPAGVEIIATHPMFGPDSARDGVKGLAMVICPLNTSVVKVSEWEKRFSSWGLSVVKMSADEHDRTAAFSQGVTHYIGRVLDGMNLPDCSIGTTGYRALQKVSEQTCHDSLTLFLDLQRYNPYAKEMRKSMKRAMNCVEKMVKEI